MNKDSIFLESLSAILLGREVETSSSLINQSSLACDAWDGLRREPDAVAREILPVLTLPVEEEEVLGARDSEVMESSAVEGEGMYESEVRFPRLGVSVAVPGVVTDWEVRESGFGPPVLRDSSVLLRTGVVGLSLESKLRRRGKVCRDGVVVLEVEANSEDSIWGVLKFDGPASESILAM